MCFGTWAAPTPTASSYASSLCPSDMTAALLHLSRPVQPPIVSTMPRLTWIFLTFFLLLCRSLQNKDRDEQPFLAMRRAVPCKYLGFHPSYRWYAGSGRCLWIGASQFFQDQQPDVCVQCQVGRWWSVLCNQLQIPRWNWQMVRITDHLPVSCYAGCSCTDPVKTWISLHKLLFSSILNHKSGSWWYKQCQIHNYTNENKISCDISLCHKKIYTSIAEDHNNWNKSCVITRICSKISSQHNCFVCTMQVGR